MAEVMASEMLARLEIMAKDVHVLSKKVCGLWCKVTHCQVLAQCMTYSPVTRRWAGMIVSCTVVFSELTWFGNCLHC